MAALRALFLKGDGKTRAAADRVLLLGVSLLGGFFPRGSTKEDMFTAAVSWGFNVTYCAKKVELIKETRKAGFLR